MSKVIQIAILGRISGNVNADEVVGNRTTLKKMYSSDGEVLPFVSARAVKYAVRQAFKERNDELLKIDPFYEDPEAADALRLKDSCRPDLYVDNDLFGYMVTKGTGGKGEAFKRQAPVALSYFKAIKDTPIKSEFAARFPRSGEKEANPVPFEVEVADFVGRLNVLIYDYVGDFTKSTKLTKEVKVKTLEKEIRTKRLSTFIEILLTPSYVLARRTNSLSIPEYYAALIYMSDQGPAPIYQYLDYHHSDKGAQVDIDKLKFMLSRKEVSRKEGNTQIHIIDYGSYVGELAEISKTNVRNVIETACQFLFS